MIVLSKSRIRRDYFKAQINIAKSDPKKTWRLTNELTSRKTSVNCNVKAIKHEVYKFN